MSQFSGGNGAFTPSTTSDNWTLHADAASEMGKIKMFGWGGRGTTSTGYRTRWARPTTDPTGAGTAITVARTSPAVAPVCALNSVYATTQATLPTDPGGNLFAIDWNVLGGGGEIVLPIGGEWFVVNSATAGTSLVSCRNVAGVDANLSNYTVQWEE
jgi:hypothetical protein